MEIGFRGLFLSLLLLAGPSVQAASDPAPEDADSTLIDPKIERIEFNEAKIDARDYEVSLLVGYISIEDFGVQPLLGLRLEYFITENIFAGLTLGQATAGKTSYEKLTYNTAFYLSGGIGTTDFAGSERFTLNYGAGYRFLFSDWLDVSVDFRNSVHDMDLFGELKTTNNLQFTLSLGFFF